MAMNKIMKAMTMTSKFEALKIFEGLKTTATASHMRGLATGKGKFVEDETLAKKLATGKGKFVEDETLAKKVATALEKLARAGARPTVKEKLVGGNTSLPRRVKEGQAKRSSSTPQNVAKRPPYQPTSVKFKKPSRGFKGLYTDGSYNPDSKRAGCGGHIRDHFGTWLSGFYMWYADNSGSGWRSEVDAMTGGMHYGLEQDMNITNLEVWSDNFGLIKTLRQQVNVDAHWDSKNLQVIKDLEAKYTGRVKYRWELREANRTADRMAFLAVQDFENLKEHKMYKFPGQPPEDEDLNGFIDDDIKGVRVPVIPRPGWDIEGESGGGSGGGGEGGGP